MSLAYEIKALDPDPDGRRRRLEELGASQLRSERQVDTYFAVERGRLKLRVGSETGPSLVAYERLDSPLVRESRGERLSLSEGQADSLGRLLELSAGVRATVSKRRTTYELGALLLHLDEVEELGRFLHLEVRSELCESSEAASQLAERAALDLGVEQADVVGWSYSDLLLMQREAAVWREKLAAVPEPGTLFVIDGPSCSGKSTLTHWLLSEADLGLELVYRYTSREPRPGEREASEYRFVDFPEFKRMAARGELMEYRDFEFGMSYGLPWSGVFEVIARGENALGVINLGNAAHLKRNFPQAVTILIDAPNEVIRQRLEARGSHTEEQIRERMQNAERAKRLRGTYDHVVINDEGQLARSKEQLREIVLGRKMSLT
jgi:guanylate kinase